MIDYHKNNKTETGEYIISHSHLCKLDPVLGGHPKIFYKAINEPEGIQTPSMERGDLLHSWIEHKDSFIIADQDKPGDQVSKLIERFYALYVKEAWKADPVFVNAMSKPVQSTIEEVIALKGFYQLITGKHEINLESKEDENAFQLLVRCIRWARIDVAYNKTLKEPTVLGHFINNISYYNFLKEANGMIILTPATKDILTNCYESIRKHPFANQLLFEIEGEHEKEYFWNIQVGGIKLNEKVNLNRKAKVDKIFANYNEKILTIVDTKTTSYPVSTYAADKYSSYYKYRNGRQLYSYADGFFRSNPTLHSGEWDVQLYNVVVQTNDEYPTIVYKTSPNKVYEFKKELEALEDMAAYHITYNIWDLTWEESINQQGPYIDIL